MHSLFSTISSFEHCSSTPGEGGIDICPCGLFCSKFDAKRLLFKDFFEIMRIFGSVQPKSECNFPFLYNLIFQPYHLSSPLAPPQEEIHICPRELLCLKFNTKKLLSKAFLEFCVFSAVFSPKVNVFFCFCRI